MSSLLEQSIDVVPGTPYTLPTNADADGQLVVIPASMQNKFCVFSARGEAVFIRFGDETVVVDEDDVNTLSSGALQADAPKAPHLIVYANTTEHVRLPAGLYTHFAHTSAATGGFLHFGPRTGTGRDADA
jgi:hypothetical protein